MQLSISWLNHFCFASGRHDSTMKCYYALATFKNTFLSPLAAAALWARIAQNVKKPSLTVNIIHFGFFCFNVFIWPLGVPLVPNSHDALVEILRFTRHVEKNKVNFAPSRCEHVENITFSLDTQINFMFSTCSSIFLFFIH